MDDRAFQPEGDGVAPGGGGRGTQAGVWSSLGTIFTDNLTQKLTTTASEQADSARRMKVNYAEKLETADPKDVFKYFLLINVSALEGFLAQSRLQAQSTFGMCKRVAYASFFIICVAIILAVASEAKGSSNGLTVATLTGLSGIITQFISAVFFYLYNRTLQQFNSSQDKLVVAQEIAISLMTGGTIGNADKRDDCSVDIVKQLLARGVSPGLNTPDKPGNGT